MLQNISFLLGIFRAFLKVKLLRNPFQNHFMDCNFMIDTVHAGHKVQSYEKPAISI
ncbi:hypothetical protein D3C87_673010 [compost metagenome]